MIGSIKESAVLIACNTCLRRNCRPNDLMRAIKNDGLDLGLDLNFDSASSFSFSFSAFSFSSSSVLNSESDTFVWWISLWHLWKAILSFTVSTLLVLFSNFRFFFFSLSSRSRRSSNSSGSSSAASFSPVWFLSNRNRQSGTSAHGAYILLFVCCAI